MNIELDTTQFLGILLFLLGLWLLRREIIVVAIAIFGLLCGTTVVSILMVTAFVVLCAVGICWTLRQFYVFCKGFWIGFRDAVARKGN